jgi:hypothetical protein
MSHEQGPDAGLIIRYGYFYRNSDNLKIKRYRCKNCEQTFSDASFDSCFKQKKRHLNPVLELLLCSGVSQRRSVFLLGVNSKTIVRKFRFLSREAKKRHEKWLSELPKSALHHIQFDDLETSEHTKCKPLSVTLGVEPMSRKILSFKVSQMPAKGKLSKIAFKKYGFREDQRKQGWDEFFKTLIPVAHEQSIFTSDENPHYRKLLKKHHPFCTHKTVKGRRAAVVGQGELKKGGFDPIFSVNHTCAMLRANMNRLFRRTWCTTKNKQGLIDHLNMYVSFHNERLTREIEFMGLKSVPGH